MINHLSDIDYVQYPLAEAAIKKALSLCPLKFAAHINRLTVWRNEIQHDGVLVRVSSSILANG
jgi:hypothetical protein